MDWERPRGIPHSSWRDRPRLAVDRSARGSRVGRGLRASSDEVPRAASPCERGAQGQLLHKVADGEDIRTEVHEACREDEPLGRGLTSLADGACALALAYADALSHLPRPNDSSLTDGADFQLKTGR